MVARWFSVITPVHQRLRGKSHRDITHLQMLTVSSSSPLVHTFEAKVRKLSLTAISLDFV
jgi:hypothetical protein